MKTYLFFSDQQRSAAGYIMARFFKTAINALALLTCCLFSMQLSANNDPVYLLDTLSKPENLGKYTQYIEDPEGLLFLEDIINTEGKQGGDKHSVPAWQQAPIDGLAAGFTDSTYWIKFSVENVSEQDIRWYLEIRYPILDNIEIYAPDQHGSYSKLNVGDNYPFSERPIDYRNLVFMHNTPVGQSQTYYLRVNTNSSMFVPLQLWPEDTFFHEIDRVKLLLGVLYGIVILALLISAVNAYFLKDMMYVWLSGIFICFFLYLAGIKGVAFQTFWPNSLFWQEISIPFFMSMSWAFGFLYARDYLALKNLSPFLDKIFVGLITSGFIGALLCFITPYKYVITFATIMVVLTQVIISAVGLYSWYKGNTAARLFVFSWLSLVIGAVSFAFIALGWFPRSFLTDWMQEIGFGAMVTLMIIAQFDRFLQIQKGHEQRQKASLGALKQAETKYRSLFENAIEGIFQMGANGKLTNVNNAFANILGIEDTDHIIETRDTPFTLGFLSESEAKKLEALLNTKEGVADYTVSFASIIGEIRWAAIAIQKVQKPGQNTYHYEGSLTDVTETKKREQAEKQRRMAEASTEAKSMFLANMSHEIRTPMNAIIGFTDLAVNANQDKNLSEFLRKIKTASSNLLGIINDILDFSKIEAGKLKIESVPFQIRELMKNIEDIVQSNIEAKGLDFSIDIDEDIPDTILGDSLRLHQVLLNLTNNAVKFTPEGSVKVELDLLAMNKKNGTIKLAGRVIDTGIGISQEKQTKLFTSFSQADESTTRTFGGTGLGLSISKQLITMMGGDIKVRSIEGKGSVFEFEFACRLESRKRGASSDKKLNVLIVDDNQQSRELIENVVKSLHHRYTRAHSAKEAIHIIKQQNDEDIDYDLIMIDWLMPEMDGLECRKALSTLPNTSKSKTMLVTTYGEEGLEEKAMECGFNYYLEKPVSEEAFQLAIDTLFSSRAVSPSPEIGQDIETHTRSKDHSTLSLDSQSDNNPKNRYDFSGLRALLVEDVAMNQELAKEILGKQGIETIIANNGKEGLDKAEQESFDLILMDMQMPVMDGIEASRAIREFNQTIPIIAMTANAMTEDKKKCLDAGMNGFVTKPINDTELFNTIAQHVENVRIKETYVSSEPNPLDSQPASTTDSISVIDHSEETPANGEPDNVSPIDETINSVEETDDSKDEAVIDLESDSKEVSLESIDLNDGLERCQGNEKLYHKLLGDFIRNYGNASEDMDALYASGDLDSIGKMSHTLKGLSANLGAKPLSGIAMKLEKIASLEANEQQNSLQEFKSSLTTLCNELSQLLDQAAENTTESNSEKYEQSELLSLANELESMINEQKMDAYDLAVEAAERWPIEEHADLLTKLVDELDLFDFEQAKQSIKALIDGIEAAS